MLKPIRHQLLFSIGRENNFFPKMETLVQYNIVILVFSAMGFFCNLGSLIYIIKTFDTKQSFFHILCMDAIVVMLATLVTFIISALAISGQHMGELSCSFLAFGAAITTLTSPLNFLMISLIR